MLNRKQFIWLLTPVLLVIFGCRAIMGSGPISTSQPTPSLSLVTALPLFTNTPSPLAPTATPQDTPTMTSEPTPTLLPESPSPTPTATEVPFTPDPTATAQQLQVFEEIWGTVNENYLYADFNGLDWNAVHDEYSQRIQAGMSNAEFYTAMDEMISRLGDDHSSYFSPEEAAELDAEFAGEYNYVGIGVLSSAIPERYRVTVLIVFPGSPAERAGIRPHDSILAVDGQPIINADGIRTNLLRGPEGTTITVSVQSPGEDIREVQITRQRIEGGLPVPYDIFTTPEGKRIGYLLLVTFNDSTVDEQVGSALENMTASGPLDGLIIDNRQNGGGNSSVLLPTLSYFTTGEVGSIVDRNEEHFLDARGVNINGSQNVPLVVLVGENTASFGEVFAGVLKDLGRAYLIGETTSGNVEILSIYNFSDGSRAWIAHSTFRPKNHPEQDWEQTGILVDQTQPSEWDQVTQATDPAIKAALDYFSQLLR